MLLRIVSQFSTNFIKRCYLTQAYSCTSVWNERMDGMNCKLSAINLAVQLQSNINSNTPISPLDFDILMNKVDEMDLKNLSYIIAIVKSFRKSQESLRIFPSSSHALIRNLIDINEPFQALSLLRNRINTGVFLDEVTVNLLIDRFLINEKWENAFLTATEWLLQECIDDSKLGIVMCSVACLQFWQRSLWQYKPPVVDLSKVPVEYKRVQFLKPDFFDDHFDLCNDNFRRRLLGKCLSMLTANFHLIESDIDSGVEGGLNYFTDNLSILGLALHEKLNDLIKYMESRLAGGHGTLNGGLIPAVIDLINTAERTVDGSPVSHPTHSEKEIQETVTNFERLVKQSPIDERDDLCTSALECFTNSINRLCENETDSVQNKYRNFLSHRKTILEKTKQNLINKKILDDSKKKLLELTEEEEMIRYFEKVPEILYKSWLAKRTNEEKKFSLRKSDQEDLDNLKKNVKPKFIVQHAA